MPEIFQVISKQRLDKFLTENLSDLSRGEIQKAIEAGHVFVDDKKVDKPSFQVKLGDSVQYQKVNSLKSVTSSLPLSILYEGHGLVIIDKPAGLTVHPSSAVKGATLVDALKVRYPEIVSIGEPDRPGIVHRLDKDTSGCLVVALTQEMYKYLIEAFFTRKVKKEYLALVWGKLEKKHGIIDAPIGKSKLDFRKMTTQDPIQAKESVTEYFVISNFQPTCRTGRFPISNDLSLRGAPTLRRGTKQSRAASTGLLHSQSVARNDSTGQFDETSLIRLVLHTGRTHQIRVHLTSIGHPLVGDALYGFKKKLPGLSRQFLHAKSIELQLPDQTWIAAESELPEDLRVVLNSLRSSESR